MLFDHPRSIAAAVAAIVASAVAAGPGGLVETQEMSFSFPLSPGSAVLPFAQFDDMDGARILQAVSVSATGSIGADITAENDSMLPAPDLAISISGFMEMGFAGLEGFVLFNETETTDGSVGPSDGIPGGGPDFWDFGTVSASGSTMAMTTDGLDVFIGAGTIDGNVSAAGGFSVAGTTDSTLVIDNFGGEGMMTIAFEFRLVAGACCLPDGSCTDATVTECEDAGGEYQGAGSDCATVVCPSGACCFEDGSCTEGSPDDFADAGGTYQGDGSDCATATCPTGGGEGCTPGYWKQVHHFGSWSDSLTPETLFGDIFEDAFPDRTLLRVLRQGGGKLRALGRHTVAALLNASSNDVSYELSAADVIAMFNDAYPGTSGDYNGLKDFFEDFNQNGCPLGRADLGDPTASLTPGGSGFTSLLDVLSTWGICLPGQPCRGDLDGDGVVDAEDLIAALVP